MFPLAAKPRPSLDYGADVGQDVAEQVGSDHDVQRVGMRNHLGGQGVHRGTDHLDVWIIPGDQLRHLIPEDHAVPLGVRLGAAGQVAAALPVWR